MLGLQEGRVYNTSVSRGLSDEYLRLPNSLPSLDDVYTYFSTFLNAYSSSSLQQGKLKRTLLENLKNNNYLLELKLDDLFQFQNLVDASSEREEDSITKQLREANNDETQSVNRKLPPFYAQELVKVLTERPLIYLSTIERVCYDVCKMHLNYEEAEKFNYIQINLLNTFCKPSPIRSLLSGKQERFVVVPGIIVQANRTQHKMRVCTIQCRFCGHKMILEVPLWIARPQIPRTCRYSSTLRSMGENAQVDQQLGCNKVQNPYVIIVNECQFVDVQILKMQELSEDVPTGDMPRHLQLNVTRYLCDKVIPGDRIYAHGVLTNYNNNPKNSESGINNSYLYVLGIQKQNVNESYEFDIEETNDLLLLASQPDIHDKIFKSIAPSLYGLDDVKMACACALFGGTRKEIGNGTKIRGDINVLILGDPSVAKSQILKFVDYIAPISIYTSGKGSSAAGLTAAVIRDNMGIFSLEGGAMVLADGGVVCIDEFDKMRPDDAVAIHEAMEQQTISISKAGITTILNTRCAIIAAANPNLGSYNNYQDNNEQHDFKTTILSRFDLIFMLKDHEDINNDKLLCKHILSLHNQNKKSVVGPINNNKLRRFIQYSKQVVSPMLSSEAKDTLRNFYVQKRREYRMDKRSSTKKIPITLRQLESLVRISESLARMELSPVASEKHVQMAIQLFTVSTGESMKSTINLEMMSEEDQKVIKRCEELILLSLRKGQRVSRRFLLSTLDKQAINPAYVQQAISILIKKGILQERGDLSLRRIAT